MTSQMISIEALGSACVTPSVPIGETSSPLGLGHGDMQALQAAIRDFQSAMGATPEPLELPSALSVLKAAFAQNVEVAKEFPQPVTLPATPETLKAAFAQNVEVAAELPRPVELPASPDTLKATVAQNVEVAKELPRPVELPATPETVKATIAQNVEVAKELPRPMEVPAAAQRPSFTTERTETPQVAARNDFGQKVDVKAAGVLSDRISSSDFSEPSVVEKTTPTTLKVTVAEGENVADDMKASEAPKEMPALPIAFAEPQDGVTVATVDVTGVMAVAGASVAEKVSEATAASVLIEAAAAVADTIQVTPALARGEGEIRIQLKPDVLEGSSIRMTVKDGVLTVDFQAAVANVVALVERCQGQLMEALGERVQGYRIAVNVKRSLKDEIV